MPLTDLTTALDAVTEADLDALDREIDTRLKALDTLRDLRKLILTRLGKTVSPARVKAPATGTNGHAPRPGPADDDDGPPATPRSPADALGQRRGAVRACLMTKGPQTQSQLSERCGIGMRGVHNLSAVLASDWFHVAPDGVVSLTTKGDRG